MCIRDRGSCCWYLSLSHMPSRCAPLAFPIPPRWPPPLTANGRMFLSGRRGPGCCAGRGQLSGGISDVRKRVRCRSRQREKPAHHQGKKRHSLMNVMDEKISGRQLTLLLFCILISTTILILPALMVQEAKQDAWLLSLIHI